MLAPFLDRLDPHVNRLKTIEISYSKYKIPEYWITTVKLLTTPQPSLERFSLRNESLQGNISRLTLFADQVPRLKDLQLYGMRINCQGAICAGLSTLSLREVTVPSSKDLLSIIQCCCHLLDLELENIRSQTVDTVDPSPERISLPLLPHLFLGKVPSTLKERILGDAYMPQSVHISLDLGEDLGDPKDFVARHVPRWLPQRTPHPMIAGIHVKPGSSGLILRFFDSKHSECFHLSLRHARSASISLAILTGVNAFLKAFAPKADIHLVLGQDSFAPAEDGDYRDQLSWLPRVTQLEIEEWWHSTYFGYWEKESAKDFKLPLFPGLQELYFYQLPSVCIIKVVGMLLDDPEARHQGGGFGVTIYVWEDSRLAEMGSTVEELKAIVGEDCVIIRVNPESKKKH